jgi:protein-tyrosine sulfotransferase
MSEANCFSLSDGTLVHPSNPFFITGSGRCGTTLMRRLVTERAEVIIPPENYILAASQRLVATASADWGLFCRMILSGLQKYTNRWEDFSIDEPLALQLLATVPAPRRSIANFWHAFHAIYATRMDRPSDTRWGDKTPANVDGLPQIMQIFPQARFVFMVRDVFDTAYSYGAMSISERAGNPQTGAQRWVDANAKVLAFADAYPAQAIIVRYEDLARFPEHEITRVLGHLRVPAAVMGALNPLEVRDITAQPHLKSVLHEVSREFICKGRANLTKADKESIANIAAPLQIQLGYEPTGMDHPPCMER